jgi:hypothetical protein
MRKRRKFADGGVTGQTQQPTYPFYGNQPMAGGQSGGMNQTFNMQPQAMSGPNDQMTQRFAKGGQAKVGKVMGEFKAGKLKSSSGQKVTNPKQAIAIGLSEAGLSKKAKGGEMKESKAMVKKEVSFMKKKGAPKSMVKHEMAEAGMKHGGKVKKMAMGGYADGGMPMVMKDGQKVPAFAADGKGKMAKGGMAMKKMASGGLAAGHKAADGVAMKGKTKAMQVKMSGSTGMKKGGMTKMKKGGYC